MDEVYPIGKQYDLMPIPPIPENCVSRDAGPLRLVVEARWLTDDAASGASEEIAAFVAERGAAAMDDHGASLHVYGADDGLEHLRFDCFENEPHYHYIRHADGGMVICRIDDHADGDPIEWTLGRLRHRLPEMLEFAHAPELAARTRTDMAQVQAAVDEVEQLLGNAHAASSTSAR